jgi:hypothetical protein
MSATRERPSLGTDVGAPDGLPSERLVSHGGRSQAREPHRQPASSDDRQMDRPLPSPAVAGRNRHETGNRSRAGRHQAGRVRSGPGAARGAAETRRHTAEDVRLATASDIRKDVPRRLAPLGLPPRRPPSSSIRRVRREWDANAFVARVFFAAVACALTENRAGDSNGPEARSLKPESEVRSPKPEARSPGWGFS